jgi:hypothetical protein
MLSLSLLAILVGELRGVTGDLEDDCEPFGERRRVTGDLEDDCEPIGEQDRWASTRVEKPLPAEVPSSISAFICFCLPEDDIAVGFCRLNSSPELAF